MSHTCRKWRQFNGMEIRVAFWLTSHKCLLLTRKPSWRKGNRTTATLYKGLQWRNQLHRVSKHWHPFYLMPETEMRPRLRPSKLFPETEAKPRRSKIGLHLESTPSCDRDVETETISAMVVCHYYNTIRIDYQWHLKITSATRSLCDTNE